jgi:hypothetical protein
MKLRIVITIPNHNKPALRAALELVREEENAERIISTECGERRNLWSEDGKTLMGYVEVVNEE